MCYNIVICYIFRRFENGNSSWNKRWKPKNTVVKNYFGKFKVVKRPANMWMEKQFQRFGNCWRNIDYKFVPFETPIPVGTRSKKNQEKTDIKDYGNIAIFTKIAMIFWKITNTFWFINSLQIICNCYS
nr:hypothetical protein [Mycoplasmopsis bovis]